MALTFNYFLDHTTPDTNWAHFEFVDVDTGDNFISRGIRIDNYGATDIDIAFPETTNGTEVVAMTVVAGDAITFLHKQERRIALKSDPSGATVRVTAW